MSNNPAPAYKTYTKDDYQHPTIYGISHLLPASLPEAVDPGKGKYIVNIGGSIFRMVKGEREIAIQSRYGYQTRKRTQWTLELVSGTDEYGLLETPSKDSKEDLVFSMNCAIQASLYKKAENCPKTFNWHDVKKAISAKKEQDKDWCIRYLTGVISFMDRGMKKEEAEYAAAGYTWLEGHLVESKWVDDMERERERKSFAEFAKRTKV